MTKPLTPAFTPDRYRELSVRGIGNALQITTRQGGTQTIITEEHDQIVGLIKAEPAVLALNQLKTPPDFTLETIDSWQANIVRSPGLAQLIEAWACIADIIHKAIMAAAQSDTLQKKLAPRLEAFYIAFQPLMELYREELTRQRPLKDLGDNHAGEVADIRSRLQSGLEHFHALMADTTTQRNNEHQKTNRRRNRHSLLNYPEALVEAYDSLYVIHLDLGYAPTSREAIRRASYERLREGLRKLFYARHRNPMWKDDLVGHIWKIEDAPFRRFHAHLLLFYRGSTAHHHQKDVERLQTRWIDEITDGAGACYARLNSNHEPVWVPENTGYFIDREDNEPQLNELKQYLEYLVSIDQLIGLETKPKTLIFAKGNLPRRSSSPDKARR